VVTGALGERAASDAVRPTIALGGAELDRRLAETVATTLQSQPGVTVTSLGPATARPVIRGLSGDRVLVLEDGVRPGDLSTTSADHAVAIDPLAARQIEVVRGPNSLLYGSSALGGVVKRGARRDPHLAHRARARHRRRAGQLGEPGRTAGGVVAMPIGHLGGEHLAVRAEGTARTGGDLETPVGRLRNTALRTYSGSASLGLVGERGHTGASYRYYGTDYGIPGGFVGAHPNGVDVRMQRHTLRGEAERRFADGGGQRRVLGLPLASVRLTAAYTDYGHRELEAGGAVGTRFDQRLGQADLLARHAAVGPFTSGAAGARVQARGIATGGALRTPSTDDLNAALFVVEEAALGRVRLQGGVRYDWARYAPRSRAVVRVGDQAIPTDPRTFGSASGSLGALVDVGGGAQLGASVARAYRTPDFNELYSDGPHLAAYSYDVGNPRLGEETGVGVDAFARVTRARFRGEVAAFRNALAGYVFPRNTGLLGRQGGRPLFQFTGRDALLAGVDGSAEWSVTPALVVDATASYVRGTLRGPRDSLPADAALGLPARLGARALPLMPPLQGARGAAPRAPALVRGGRRARRRAAGAARRLRDPDGRLRGGRPHRGAPPARRLAAAHHHAARRQPPRPGVPRPPLPREGDHARGGAQPLAALPHGVLTLRATRAAVPFDPTTAPFRRFHRCSPRSRPPSCSAPPAARSFSPPWSSWARAATTTARPATTSRRSSRCGSR
jgi:iron complex outermembrane receptor protein